MKHTQCCAHVLYVHCTNPFGCYANIIEAQAGLNMPSAPTYQVEAPVRFPIQAAVRFRDLIFLQVATHRGTFI